MNPVGCRGRARGRSRGRGRCQDGDISSGDGGVHSSGRG